MRALPILAATLLLGCGADVILDDPGAGGSGSTSTAIATGTSAQTAQSATAVTATSASTGTGPCSAHEQCATGVCYFPTGECIPSCQPGTCDSCGPGSYCEPCAIGSCPGCSDCIAACVPISPGRCDDDDPCVSAGGETACYFPGGVCLPVCNPELPNGGCNGFELCDFCATGSCCGCDDCVGLCVGGE